MPDTGSEKIPKEGSCFDMAASAKTKTAAATKVVATKAKKPPPKPAAKPTPKAAAKPVPKPMVKPAVKAAVKVAVKSVAKPTSKLNPVSASAAKAVKSAVATASKTQASAIPVISSSIKPVAKTNTVPVTPTPPKAVILSLDAHKKYAGLTEAELMKQPESSYMSKEQLAFFKEKLSELRSTILHNATDTGEHLRDVEVATDPSDRATQEEEYTLELRTRDRERKLLKKVDKALRMIDDASFGWCEETGEPIGLARLIARPTATLSIEAQERRERMQKLYGD